MREALTKQTIQHNSKNSAQGTNVRNNLTELRENRAKGTNVTNNRTALTEKSAQGSNKTNNQTEVKDNAQRTNVANIPTKLKKTVRKALT